MLSYKVNVTVNLDETIKGAIHPILSDIGL